ncbi:DUF748 domain-containing protein [Methylophaga sp.]|uniref:DUF748 domain-containing protein n=1 Tax=Methylophaga sp. TaxID=2024840 RepID=UPI003F69CAE5
MNSFKTTLLKYKRLLIGLISIVILYTLLGFFFVPWIAEKQLVTTLKERLDVQASVEEITFNPFTFQLNVNSLELADGNQEPLGSWDTLYINLQPAQLVKRDLTFEKISIQSPKWHFRRYSESENTLTRLANNWNQTAEKEASETTKVQEDEGDNTPFLTVRINDFDYTSGELHYRDDVPAENFKTVLSPINIHLTDFSTQPGQSATNELVINLEKDAELTLDGNVILSPLHLDGRMRLKNFSLQTPYRYLSAALPFELNNGRLDLNLAYNVDVKQGDADIDLSEISLQLADLSIQKPGEDADLLDGNQVKITNGQFAYPENQLKLDKVLLDGFDVSAIQNKQGELNWVQMFADQNSESEAPSQNDDATPFLIDIADITIANTRVNLNDQLPEKPVNLSLEVSANMQNFSLEADNRMPFSSSISLASGGDIDVQGNMQLFPEFALQSEWGIEQLSLLPVQPYLNQYAFIELIKGNVDSNATIKVDQQDPFAFNGDLALNTTQLDNQKLDEKLLSVDKLTLNTIDFSLAKRSLAISEVIVEQLYSRVLVTKGGETNVSLLMKPLPENNEPEPETEQSSASPGFAISVGRVAFNDASSQFTDQNLPIVFNANMHKLNGEVSGFSTASKQPVDLDLEGQVDEFGLVEINGSLNPLNVSQQTKVNLAFSNLDLPDMSPYTIKFAGREIAEGRGDIELTYEIVEGELDATNSVVISDIRLGERIESPDAMDLPLDLAIALLKNSDGVIDLSIPVSGNVNDPQFDMSSVIRGAIANVLGNIVTAPFRLLANLIGGSDDVIDNIRFRPGRSDLSPPEQEKLLKLIEALQQRPQLALQIPAPFAPSADVESLRQNNVEDRIDYLLTQTESDQQLVLRKQGVLERLYAAASLSPETEILKQDMIEASKTEQAPEGELDDLAYNAKLKKALIEAETVTESDLKALALARQKSVVEFIQEKGGLKANQIQTQDVISEQAKEGWLTMKFDLDAL